MIAPLFSRRFIGKPYRYDGSRGDDEIRQRHVMATMVHWEKGDGLRCGFNQMIGSDCRRRNVIRPFGQSVGLERADQKE
jgi:hypothetical protein